jgi:hypothetical protein
VWTYELLSPAALPKPFTREVNHFTVTPKSRSCEQRWKTIAMPSSKRARERALPPSYVASWRADLQRLLGDRQEAVDGALETIATALLDACPELVGSRGECPILSLRDLTNRSNAHSSDLSELALPSCAPCGVVVAWLLPDAAGVRSALGELRLPADVGGLTLCDSSSQASGSCTLPCSASTEVGLAPENLGQLVLLTRWKWIPAVRHSQQDGPAASNSADSAAVESDSSSGEDGQCGGYIELDGPLIACLPQPRPPRVGAFEVAQVWRSIRRMARRGEGGDPERHCKLLNLRGELTALSEPFGLIEPIVAAEFSSAP